MKIDGPIKLNDLINDCIAIGPTATSPWLHVIFPTAVRRADKTPPTPTELLTEQANDAVADK